MRREGGRWDGAEEMKHRRVSGLLMASSLPGSASVRPLEAGRAFTFGNFECFPFARRSPTCIFSAFNCTSAERAAASETQLVILETLQQILIFYTPILLCACLVLPELL